MFSDTTKLYTNTLPIDREKAATAVKALYRYCNVAPNSYKNENDLRPSRDPEIIFVNGPTELKEKINLDDPFFNASNYDEIAHFVTKRGWGPEEAMHSLLADVFNFRVNKKKPNGLIVRWSTPMLLVIDYLYDDKSEDRGYVNKYEDLVSEVWNHSYVVFTFVDKCFIMERPIVALSNDKGFHCKDGPALIFRDGTEVYAYEGIKVKKNHLLRPQDMTLRDIHQHNSRKHYLIDMVGVDHYLSLVKAWKPPETKDRFEKFFSFSKMVLPGDDLPDEKDERGYTKWRERGYGHNSYKTEKDAYKVKIEYGTVNGEHGLCIYEDREFSGSMYFFKHGKHPFDTKAGKLIFEEKDRELWDLFDVRETLARGSLSMTLSYCNKEFRLKVNRLYDNHPACRHDIAPAWFKAKMFRNEPALYETEKYAIKWEDGQLLYAGEVPKERGSLFGGLENLPSYNFDIDLVSDSWAGLLEKWARLAFEWLGMHEDSARMP